MPISNVSSDKARQIRIGCVQMRSTMDVEANIRAASTLIREAAAGGAELVATPEMTSLMDHTPGALYAKSHPQAEDPALAAFRSLAAELKIALLVGSLHIREAGGLCANRSFLLDTRGEIAATY